MVFPVKDPQIKTLVHDLSDDPDLALLRKTSLVGIKKREGWTRTRSLLALIDNHRAELQTRACFLGQRIYAERPKALRVAFSNIGERGVPKKKPI